MQVIRHFARLRDLGFKICARDFTSKKSEPEILIAENFEFETMVQIKLYKAHQYTALFCFTALFDKLYPGLYESNFSEFISKDNTETKSDKSET